MTPYTILYETAHDGRHTAALRDGDWSFSMARAHDVDPNIPEAALERLAEQLADNLEHDRMTQIMLDPSRIPEPLASKVRDLWDTP